MAPDIILLQVGGNDLTGEEGLWERTHEGVCVSVTKLADGMVDFARRMRRWGIPRVAIGKLFYRGRGSHLRSEREVVAYNAKVQAVNAHLDHRALDLDPGIFVWNHKGREQCAEEILTDDGTHLNERGLHKYWWSWRRALISTRAQLDHGMCIPRETQADISEYFPRCCFRDVSREVYSAMYAAMLFRDVLSR